MCAHLRVASATEPQARPRTIVSDGTRTLLVGRDVDQLGVPADTIAVLQLFEEDPRPQSDPRLSKHNSSAYCTACPFGVF
jgi:hypothetical protein